MSEKLRYDRTTILQLCLEKKKKKEKKSTHHPGNLNCFFVFQSEFGDVEVCSIFAWYRDKASSGFI